MIGSGRRCWKGRCQLEGLEGTSDSDVVAGAVGSVINCKGWNRTLLTEGLDPDVVDGRDVGFGRCCWSGWIRQWTVIGWVGRRLEEMLSCDPIRLFPYVDWKGWIRTTIGRVGSGRQLEGMLLLLIVPIAVVDCPNQHC